jgi:hypothetical protein
MKKRVLRILIPFAILIVASVGCGLFSKKGGDADVVFPATQIGAPQGDKLTKDIGPAGGSITSSDDRLRLTVPAKALTETLSFSIQPITNTAGGGIGLGYRLEPSGKTFATPLAISIRYNDNDLEGTIPEALSLAYQDQNGAWRAQRSMRLDQAAKTISTETTHFTDFAELAGIRISPAEATIYVGEEQTVQLVQCKESGVWDKLLSRTSDCDHAASTTKQAWSLSGPGNIQEASISGENYDNIGVIYEAPARKPTPNAALVNLRVEFVMWDPTTGETSTVEKTFSTKITIIDRGYRASGGTGPYFSGLICSLEKPFEVIGTMGPVTITNEFAPTSDAAGNGKSSAVYGPTLSGSGPYTITGIGTDKMQIVYNVTSKLELAGRASGGTAPAVIDLIPLTGNECKGK